MRGQMVINLTELNRLLRLETSCMSKWFKAPGKLENLTRPVATEMRITADRTGPVTMFYKHDIHGTFSVPGFWRKLRNLQKVDRFYISANSERNCPNKVNVFTTKPSDIN